MAKLNFTVIASLDGFMEDAEGSITWANPGPEVHAFVNDLVRPIGIYLYGRRMYETMVYWETDDDPDPVAKGFASTWRSAEKVVFSRTLQEVSSANTRLERNFDPKAIRLMKETSETDLSIEGPELAGQAIAAGLVDECGLFIVPVIVGGGKRALPDNVRLNLDLQDERRFQSGVVYLEYRIRA